MIVLYVDMQTHLQYDLKAGSSIPGVRIIMIVWAQEYDTYR